MSQQFDLPPDQIKLYERRAKRRAALRQFFLKERTDPFKFGEGGYVFDPAYQRYQALRVSTFEYFKPTAKSGFGAFCAVLLPMIVTWYVVTNQKNKEEHLYRTGQVAYKDRNFKFI